MQDGPRRRRTLKRHPDIEMISRDRCGSFAQGAREGAPQARQVADRFHILQNLREAIQAQLGRTAGSSTRPLLPADVDDEREPVISRSPRINMAAPSIAVSLEWRASVQGKRCLIGVGALHREGRSVSDIVRQTGFDRRTIAKWIRADAFPLRQCSGAENDFATLFRRISIAPLVGGCARGRRLFQEIKARGYTGSFSNLERLLGKWRNPKRKVVRLCCPLQGRRGRSGDWATDLAMSSPRRCKSSRADH